MINVQKKGSVIVRTGWDTVKGILFTVKRDENDYLFTGDTVVPVNTLMSGIEDIQEIEGLEKKFDAMNAEGKFDLLESGRSSF